MRVYKCLGSPVSAGSSMLMLQKPEQEYLAEGGAMPCWGSLSILALIYLMLWWGKLKVYFYMILILLTRHDKTWCKFSRGVWNHIQKSIDWFLFKVFFLLPTLRLGWRLCVLERRFASVWIFQSLWYTLPLWTLMSRLKDVDKGCSENSWENEMKLTSTLFRSL